MCSEAEVTPSSPVQELVEYLDHCTAVFQGSSNL